VKQSNGLVDQTKPDADQPKWHARPDWWLVGIALVTGCIICWQSWETRKAAEAALKQANHMVASERAWILVDIGEPESDDHAPDFMGRFWIRPVIRNSGKTIAKITKIRAVIRLNGSGERLPYVPEYPLGQGFDSDKWNLYGMNLVLAPDAPTQPFKLVLSSDEFEQVKTGQRFLYVHGFIDYSDFLDEQRRTAFCYYYAVQGVFDPDPSRFYLELTAPPTYNQCT
jgi:hypothetical protein